MPFLSSSGISPLNIIRGGAAGEATALLLDLYPGASAAYSLIKLSSTYTGDAIRVRETASGLNNEQDIGFDVDGNLDTAALLSFTGAGDGFITIWYDQSGNADNIIQSAAADQPQIVSSGSIIIDGDGIIAPSYDGVNDDMLLSGTPFAFSTDSMSLFMVAKALGNNQNAFNLADTNDYFAATYGRSTPGQLVVGYYEDGGLVNESIEGTAGVDKHLLSTIFTRGTTSLAGWINGSAMTNPATGLLRANFNTNVIGSRGGAYELNGTIQLMVIYDSDQTANRSGIETIINNDYSIYP